MWFIYDTTLFPTVAYKGRKEADLGLNPGERHISVFSQFQTQYWTGQHLEKIQKIKNMSSIALLIRVYYYY